MKRVIAVVMAALMALSVFAFSAVAAAKKDIPDGEYQVEVAEWKADEDSNSHAQMIEQVADLSVKNGVRTITLKTKGYTMPKDNPMKSYIKSMRVKGADGRYFEATPVGTNSAGYPAAYTFVLPSDDDVIPFQQQSMLKLGSLETGSAHGRGGYVDMRLKIYYDTLVPKGQKVDVVTSASYTGDKENAFFQFFKQLGL